MGTAGGTVTFSDKEDPSQLANARPGLLPLPRLLGPWKCGQVAFPCRNHLWHLKTGHQETGQVKVLHNL